MSDTTTDGQFWVRATLDGRESKYGPYRDTDTAHAVAARFRAICHVLHFNHTEPVVQQERPAPRQR